MHVKNNVTISDSSQTFFFVFFVIIMQKQTSIMTFLHLSQLYDKLHYFKRILRYLR